MCDRSVEAELRLSERLLHIVVIASLAVPFALSGAQFTKATDAINAFLNVIESRADAWVEGQTFGFDRRSLTERVR